MNNTETNLTTQVQPVLVYKVNKNTSLPFDVTEELEKYSRIFVTKEVDPFRIIHCFEAASRDYLIYGETKDGDKKLLFTCHNHFECCNCCDQYIIGGLCCVYACCDSIVFQLDYRRNGNPFYTQGFNIYKGCHCCDQVVCDNNCTCLPCPGRKLYLRENMDPDSPDIKVGIQKGKTKVNCCCACDKYVDYYTENKLKGQTVRAACCDICLHSCFAYCCGTCHRCIQGCDFEMSIEDENRIKTGNVFIYSGCCSKKVEGKCFYMPRAYFEVNMPLNANSEQKFQIIADLIHLDLANNII